MPYEMSLEPDLDRGGHLYRAALSGELDPAAVRQLSEWIGDAKLNPDARFVIDLTAVSRTDRRARLELRALLRRHAELRDAGRLSVLTRPRRSAAAAVAPAASLLSVPVPL
jgi:anti-anti-sigma regulatory factor